MGLLKVLFVTATTLCACFVAMVAVGVVVMKDAVQAEYAALWTPLKHLDVDGFTGGPAPFLRQLQVVATERLTGADQFPLEESLTKTQALEWVASPSVDGLRVTRAAQPGSKTLLDNVDGAKALVVGTIRMGFGHHRIAYAMSSWGAGAQKKELPGGVYFHDLLSIESPEARLIHDTDALYRKSSKLATEVGGPFELLHGFLTSSGDATSLRSTALVGARLAPLMRGLPKKAPVVATHTLVALAAAAAGAERILNLVIDNHPQWFVVAPGALNLVQGPRNYYGFLQKFEAGGVEPAEADKRVALAGHWIPKAMVEGIEKDCDRRIRRAKLPATKAPRRVLVPVGGAGAQKKFITELFVEAAPLCRSGHVQLVLNAGDHADMKAALLEVAASLGFTEKSGDLAIVHDHAGVVALGETFAKGDKAGAKVTILAFTDYFAAVAATDVLVPSIDVLACKPSELAFYPVPKLMIRRVGDHEAFSASRANELGDGTAEVRTVPDAVLYLKRFVASAEPLATMNAMIKRHDAWGAYSGCKNALELARA